MEFVTVGMMTFHSQLNGKSESSHVPNHQPGYVFMSYVYLGIDKKHLWIQKPRFFFIDPFRIEKAITKAMARGSVQFFWKMLGLFHGKSHEMDDNWWLDSDAQQEIDLFMLVMISPQ